MRLLPVTCLFSIATLLFSACGGEDIKCKNVVCGDNAGCDSDTGDCICDPGYAGASCADCAEGYHADADGCTADECAQDADCDDGLTCTGDESCQAGVCLAGTAVECAAHSTCQEPDGACACDPGYLTEGDACVADLDILGAWIDDWGFGHDVTRDAWTSGDSVFHIAQTDMEGSFFVAQNDEANPWTAGLWSKFEWGYGGEVLYYCQIAYAADTQEEAAAVRANRASLSTGCGGFAWSRLRERLEIAGSWIDDWGYDHAITQDTWTTAGSTFHTTQFDNQADYLVAQNDEANAWSAGLWSRFDWTWDGAGELFYCQVAYDAADEATAAANDTADRSELDTGCGGFGWSHLNTN